MQPAHRPLTTTIAGGIATTGLALASAPWWLTVAAFGCFALGLAVVALQTVFPQDSAHRLAWWRALWRHRQLRRQPPPGGRPVTRPVMGSADSDEVGASGDAVAVREETRSDR